MIRWPTNTCVQARRPLSGGGPGSTGTIELAVAGTEAVGLISFKLTAWPSLSGCILLRLLHGSVSSILSNLRTYKICEHTQRISERLFLEMDRDKLPPIFTCSIFDKGFLTHRPRLRQQKLPNYPYGCSGKENDDLNVELTQVTCQAGCIRQF